MDHCTKQLNFAAFRKMPWVCFKSIVWYYVMFFPERYSRGGKKNPWVSRSNQTWKLHLYLNNKRLVHSRIINASSGTRELTLKCKFKCYINRLNGLCSTSIYTSELILWFHYLCSQCCAAQHSYVPLLSIRRDSPRFI